MDLCSSGQESVEDSCKHGNVFPVSVKARSFLTRFSRDLLHGVREADCGMQLLKGTAVP